MDPQGVGRHQRAVQEDPEARLRKQGGEAHGRHRPAAQKDALDPSRVPPVRAPRRQTFLSSAAPAALSRTPATRLCRATTDIKDTHDAALADVQKTTEDGLRQLRGAAAASAAVMSDASESDGDF